MIMLSCPTQLEGQDRKECIEVQDGKTGGEAEKKEGDDSE